MDARFLDEETLMEFPEIEAETLMKFPECDEETLMEFPKVKFSPEMAKAPPTPSPGKEEFVWKQDTKPLVECIDCQSLYCVDDPPPYTCENCKQID